VKLSIIIPGYDEAVRLPPYLNRIKRYLDRQDLDHEVIVVNDGSTDGMAALIEEQMRDWHRSVLYSPCASAQAVRIACPLPKFRAWRKEEVNTRTKKCQNK